MVAQKDSEAPQRGDRGLISSIRSEFGFIRGNFLILILSWIMMDFAQEMPGTYYQLYVTRLGGTATTIGLIAFASMIARSVIQFPGGYLADKTGRKWLISTMTFGMAISYVLPTSSLFPTSSLRPQRPFFSFPMSSLRPQRPF